MRSAIVGSFVLMVVAVGILAAQPPRGPGGRGGPPGPRGPGGRMGPPPRLGAVDPTVPRRNAAEDHKGQHGLIENGDLEIAGSGGHGPQGFELTGDCVYGYLGDPTKDRIGWGVRLVSGRDVDGDGQRQGQLSCSVRGLDAAVGRWYRFRIRALGQPSFSSSSRQLFLRAEFFANDGANPLDAVSQNLYGALEQARNDRLSGDTGPEAAAIWRSFEMKFRLPFPEVDTLRLSVGFKDGDGQGDAADFLVDDVELDAIDDPAEYVAAVAARTAAPASPPPALARLTPIAGRWYYDPRGVAGEIPTRFDDTNADQLYYRTDRLEAPFADNMTAWLKRGYLDVNGKPVAQDRFVSDNVVLSFTRTHLVLKSHNLPNHPTAVFPDVTRSLDGNPHHIREQDQTFYLPLEPQVNPQHEPLRGFQNRYVMNPGPIGVACNGVVFFDPFDADAEDALWRLDRCCGHPSPMEQYHYHKYPVCVKTPWIDDGTAHSPLIGFAFDGFPVYGPYEAAGVMAKDDRERPLNEFNLHEDSARGPHYHVTPGQFPYIIGGHWGAVEPRNVRRGRPPRG